MGVGKLQSLEPPCAAAVRTSAAGMHRKQLLAVFGQHRSGLLRVAEAMTGRTLIRMSACRALGFVHLLYRVASKPCLAAMRFSKLNTAFQAELSPAFHADNALTARLRSVLMF